METSPFKGKTFRPGESDPRNENILIIAEIIPGNSTRFLLSGKESIKTLSFFRKEDRDAYCFRHHWLNTWLSHYCNKPFEQLKISLSKEGKPYIEDCGFHFNISRSGKYVAFGFGPEPLGVDVETMKDPYSFRAVADRHFHPNEKMHINQHQEDFFTIWTRKEAILKAAGTGLTDDLHLMDSMQEYYLNSKDRYYLKSYKEREFVVSMATQSEKDIVTRFFHNTAAKTVK